MTTYFWVAFGSALGGMARYWLTVTMTALTGPDFPWGTILINVLGSFVIGLFAILTGLDGRLSVPFDARIFVLTGLCGGFTTFSAFSLQTLELMRDGRWMQAGGNIALSLVLCLSAAALGAFAADLANAAGRSAT